MEKSKLTIINLRGTSGSGKTTIVRNILSHGNWVKWNDPDGKKIWGYINLDLKWAIVGSYENTCGGCDTIRTQDETEQRIEFLLDWELNVLFEGLLISTLSSRWEKFAKRVADKADVIFYYLDTPVEECLRRVQARRQAAGNNRPFNPKNTTERVKAIETTYQKLTAAGCYCVKASQEEIMNNLNRWFGLGG